MENNSINIIKITGTKNQVFSRIANLCKWNNGKTTLGELAKERELRALTFNGTNYWAVN
jgi:hypothetical protein